MKIFSNNLEVLFCFGHLQNFDNFPINLKRIIINEREINQNKINLKLPFNTELLCSKFS